MANGSKYFIGNESMISYSAPSQSNFNSLQDVILFSSNMLCNEVDCTEIVFMLLEIMLCAD